MYLIDSHAHIYPDAIALKASRSIADFYHLAVQEDGRLSTLLARGAQAGITRHLVHSVAITPDRAASINDYLMRTVAAEPSRLIGFGALHPAMADIPAELRRLRAGGMLGVKVHPDFQRFLLDGDESLAMFTALADADMPALVHVGDPRHPYSQPERMANVLQKLPTLKVICAHLGGWSVWDEAWKHLADFPNVWVDTCSSLYALTPEHAAAVIRHYDGEHVFFATDYPMWDPVEERARFDALPLTQPERERIAHQNIEKFLKELTPHA